MKIHLVNARTGHFFESVGRWTSSPSHAACFEFASQAINFAFELGIEDAELLLVFDLPYYQEVRLRLGRVHEPVLQDEASESLISFGTQSPVTA